MYLNTRDLALLIVVGLLALYLWRQHSLGNIVRSFARILASRVLIEFTLLLVAWASMLVLIAERFELWDPSMLHDTTRTCRWPLRARSCSVRRLAAPQPQLRVAGQLDGEKRPNGGHGVI